MASLLLDLADGLVVDVARPRHDVMDHTMVWTAHADVDAMPEHGSVSMFFHFFIPAWNALCHWAIFIWNNGR